MMKTFKFGLVGLLVGLFFPCFGYCQMSSIECQTEYNLIPFDAVDTNYCVQNDLCPVPENFSQLYINDIEHQSFPVININIPDEFNWIYTGNGGSFDLSIEGYNVDTEYIEGIINTQNSKPNNQDFNNIITGVLPLLIPGFVIIMFIYFIFRLIKKIF